MSQTLCIKKKKKKKENEIFICWNTEKSFVMLFLWILWVWPESTLFATHPQFLDTSTYSKMNLS